MLGPSSQPPERGGRVLAPFFVLFNGAGHLCCLNPLSGVGGFSPQYADELHAGVADLSQPPERGGRVLAQESPKPKPEADAAVSTP